MRPGFPSVLFRHAEGGHQGDGLPPGGRTAFLGGGVRLPQQERARLSLRLRRSGSSGKERKMNFRNRHCAARNRQPSPPSAGRKPRCPILYNLHYGLKGGIYDYLPFLILLTFFLAPEKCFAPCPPPADHNVWVDYEK